MKHHAGSQSRDEHYGEDHCGGHQSLTASTSGIEIRCWECAGRGADSGSMPARSFRQRTLPRRRSESIAVPLDLAPLRRRRPPRQPMVDRSGLLSSRKHGGLGFAVASFAALAAKQCSVAADSCRTSLASVKEVQMIPSADLAKQGQIGSLGQRSSAIYASSN